MAVKASAQITLTGVVDVVATYRYYLLQSSTLDAPSRPTVHPPSGAWMDTEPTYTDGSTNSLYFVDCTVFSDDSFVYSLVSLSSAYEAAKLAYNKATGVEESLGMMDVTLREEIKAAQQDLRSEASVLEASLKSELTAVSEQFGSFQENIESTISLTAREILQRYGYDAAIEALQSEAAGFEAYRLKTEGYIRQGFIDYDENGVPIIGIAIGQGLTSTTVTIDGEEYEQFDPTQSCAFYTAERVSFRIHGQEVAYVSNRKLYIGDVEITGNAVLGQWQLRTDNGFAIKWIGGDG